MKRVVVGFSKAKSKFAIFSRLIRYVQGTPFSHVYTRVNWPSAGQDLIYQASGLKVNFDSFNHFNEIEDIIAEFTFDVNDDTWCRLASFMTSQLSKPYSIKEVFGLFIKSLFHRSNPFRDGPASYVCSELGADILNTIDQGNRDSEDLSPKELYNLLKAKQ